MIGIDKFSELAKHVKVYIYVVISLFITSNLSRRELNERYSEFT